MKRKDTGEFRGDLLKIVDAFAIEKKLSIADSTTQQALLDDLSKVLEESRTTPIRLHGFRIESMFAYVAAALGNCKIINGEDSGVFLHGDATEMSRPDFRIITLENKHFFVEVKNHRPDNVEGDFEANQAYIDRLSAYAETMSLPLKFAIYWCHWNLWTLVDPQQLKPAANGKRSISLIDAYKSNQMRLLGDVTIGTIPPLEIHFHFVRSDGDGPIIEGHYPVTITDVQAFSGGKQIADQEEGALAFFFCRFGTWHDQKVETHTEDGNKIIQKLHFAPEIRNPGQEFEVLGTMSQMISKQYSENTVKDHVITSISPSLDPDQFGVIIPKDYQGKDLHLWRLILKPDVPVIEPED